MPKDVYFEDETKANSQNSNSFGLFGGISAMLSSKRLSTNKKEKDDSDIRNPEISPAGATGPEKKSFLQRAFGFMTSDSNPTSDPEEDDIEAGVSKGNSKSEKQNTATVVETTSPMAQTQARPSQQNNAVQSRNIVQPSPKTQPPPVTKQNLGPSPPRPHSVNNPLKATPAPNNKSVPITEDMKRRHSIAASRALAQEALKVAQARKTSLNERVSVSKNTLNSQPTNLTYDNIYLSDQPAKEEVILENNDQLIGLNRHRESEIQRQSRMSQSSAVSIAERDDDDSEEEKEDQFSSQSNPMMKSVTKPAGTQPPPTNLRSMLASPTGQQDKSFEPDNSAKTLEKRRHSTRFPSIKGKREMFLMRSETGSSVGSNASIDQQSGTSKKTTESQVTGEGSGLSGISNTSPVTVESALSRRISRKYVAATTNTEDFAEKVTKFYPYNELKRPTLLRSSSSLSSTGGAGDGDEEPSYQLPSDVNPKYREQYLTDQEFEAIFHMSKSAFNAQPKWKKQELKKRHNLF